MEKAVYIQVEEYLTSNDLIYEYQSGFRKGHSTTSALVYLTDLIKSETAKGNYVGLLALDVQKAFDCVNHDILCNKLELMGIQSQWFRSYLNNRTQIVNINGFPSEEQTIRNGVPQGSLLGPLLYLCYSNDMKLSVNSKLLLYADDSIILVSDKDPQKIEEKLSSDLNKCYDWLVANKLSIHFGKCELILFGSKRKCKNKANFTVTCNGHNITSQSSIRYLGSNIDQHTSGKENLLDVCAKANTKLKFLYRHSKHLDKATRKILCSALIQGQLEYACLSYYHSLNITLKKKLQIVQNKIVRFIQNLGPRHHVGHKELNELKLLNVNDRMKQLSLNLMFNIYHDKGAVYLKEFFKKTSHNHITRSSFASFQIPQVNSITKTSFNYNATQEWNSLPEELKLIQNKDSFKKHLKQHLLSKAVIREHSIYV